MAITQLHHHLGLLCPDLVVTTDNNETTHPFSFKLQTIFPVSATRYIPYRYSSALAAIAKENNCGYIICEHPYMAPTAMKVAKKLGIPWFIRSHNIESERFRGLGKKWWPALHSFERYAMQKADGIFFITEEDSIWAQKNFGIAVARCHTVPFGTTLQQKPAKNNSAKQELAATIKANASVPWLYFLGALDYMPNIEAVNNILDHIAPVLEAQNIAHQILIGGKGLPAEIAERIKAHKHIQYLGFIDDLEQFINACDVMLNPMLSGGGVKTKAIEALAYNKQVVSTTNGAAGIMQSVCGNNLHITADNDWQAYTTELIEVINKPADIPQAFYETYYAGNIAAKVISILKSS